MRGEVVATGRRRRRRQRISVVWAYLLSVYPAAVSKRQQHRDGIAAFEALDYYYAPYDDRAARVRPPAKFNNGSGGVPGLPYVPRGAYYLAEPTTPRPARWVAGGSRERWARPVRLLEQQQLESPLELFSTVGSRLGPAPSWTNPLALVKYPLYPMGLGRSQVPLPWLREAVARGFVEIEQFGGPLWVTECPDAACGLWANVWRGTGTFLRVDPNATLLSASKATAIREMAEALEPVDAVSLARYLDLEEHVRTGSDLADAIYARRRPCRALDDAAWRTWAKNASREAPPLDVYWGLGLCGLGAHFERTKKKFAGFDALLMVLACLRGLKTLVFEASPNDNGLFHTEVVDFDYPGGWEKKRPNSIDRCLPPVRRGDLKKALPTVEALVAYWRKGTKFALLDPFLDYDNVSACDMPDATYWTEDPADPHFPDISRATACRSTGLARLADPGRPLRTCYLLCRNAMSRVHATISDTHLYYSSSAS